MNKLAEPNLALHANRNEAHRSEDLPPAQVIALSELHGTVSSKTPVIEGANPLHQIKTRLQVSVGEVTVTVGELLAAKEHQVWVLEQHIEQPVDLLLEGKVVARGQLMAVDDRFAVRITELPVPLKP